MLIVGGVWLATQFPAPAQEAPPAPPSRAAGITVKQAEIVGQVFIATERPGEQEEPARDVRVQIRIPENDEVIYETRTDKIGGYTFPQLKVGAYRLVIGGMKLNLLVESTPVEIGELPKVIITILPRDLVRRPG